MGIFYNSWSGYNDELVWGALWLYKATGDNAYLEKAKNYYDQFGLQGRTSVMSWDEKTAGAQILLAQLTGEDKYLNDAKGVCQSYLNMPQSPGGRSHYLQWGSLRYAMNMAFICLQAADLEIIHLCDPITKLLHVQSMIGNPVIGIITIALI